MRSVVVVIAFVSAASACSSSSPSSKPPCDGVAPEQQETCLTDHYFVGASPSSFQPCAGFTPTEQKIQGRREIAFFAAPGVGDGDVVAEGRSLQRFYQPYELTFFTRAPMRAAGLEYAIEATNEELQTAAEQAGVPPGKSPTPEQEKELNRLVGDVLFRDLRNFILSDSKPPKERINVVVLSNVASPTVASQLQVVIGGLGLSPAVFKEIAADDPSRNLFELLALPPDFTPTLFVGHADIETFAKNRDIIVAHEMGHALGLKHTQEPGNLMTQLQAQEACVAGLTDEQVAQLRSTGMVIGSFEESWRMLVDIHARVVSGVVARNLARAR